MRIVRCGRSVVGREKDDATGAYYPERRLRGRRPGRRDRRVQITRVACRVDKVDKGASGGRADLDEVDGAARGISLECD